MRKLFIVCFIFHFALAALALFGLLQMIPTKPSQRRKQTYNAITCASLLAQAVEVLIKLWPQVNGFHLFQNENEGEVPVIPAQYQPTVIPAENPEALHQLENPAAENEREMPVIPAQSQPTVIPAENLEALHPLENPAAENE